MATDWDGEPRGFEPLTYSMRTSRATNCAIAPSISRPPKVAAPMLNCAPY